MSVRQTIPIFRRLPVSLDIKAEYNCIRWGVISEEFRKQSEKRSDNSLFDTNPRLIDFVGVVSLFLQVSNCRVSLKLN